MAAMPPTLRQTLAYGALGLPLAMAALPMYVYLPQLYAQAGGMSLGLLGALLLGARVADAGIDPLLGAWADRARRRPLLVALALPFLAAGLFGLMHPPASGRAAWLMVFMLITFFGFSLATVAYQAWGAEAGGDAAGRTRLTASREGFGLLGVLLAAVLPGLLSAELGRGLSLLAWIYPPLLLGAAWLSWRGTPVAPAAPVVSNASRSAAAISLTHAWRNARFVRLLAVFAVNGTAAALPATLVLFFVADVLQAPAWGGPFLAIYFLSGVLCLPLWVALARRLGRMRAWSAGMLLACAAFAGAYGLGSGDILPFALVCLLSGAALGADLALPAALLADIAEDNDGAGGRSGPGACFGWWNLVAKLNLALAAGLALPLLAWLGYRPGSVDGEAHGALAAVYCLLPLALKLLAAALCWRWRFQLEHTPGDRT